MRCHAWGLGIFLSALVVSCNSWAQTTATLAVQVAAQGSDSPSGLVVVAGLSVPDTAAGFSGQRAFASVTDVTGQVSFTGLPFGIYSVCVEPQNQLYVSPCQWSPPDTVHLTSQNTSGTVALSVQRGVPVDIRIDDPDGLLSSSIATAPAVVARVVTPQGPLHLQPAAQDVGGINYRIIAPPSVAASIQISAGALDILDGTGTPVSFSSLALAPSFNLAPTATGQFFRYTLRKNQ
jgi:hypothetical protein